jgi:NAD(P)-dependent dehydrogenase (short-subunit alcohol dehydrogenase family)
MAGRHVQLVGELTGEANPPDDAVRNACHGAATHVEVRKCLGVEVDALGEPDAVINAAGGNDPRVTVTDELAFEDIDLDAWGDSFDLNLVAGVTKDLTDRIRAGELANAVAQQVGGRGGGRPDMAQAGGNRPESLPEALASVPAWVQARLAEAAEDA